MTKIIKQSNLLRTKLKKIKKNKQENHFIDHAWNRFKINKKKDNKYRNKKYKKKNKRKK